MLRKIIKKYRSEGARGVLVAVIRKICVVALTIYFDRAKPRFGLNKTEVRDKKVIISLTSYTARFSMLHICIKSLLRQSFKPDKIILYLGDDASEGQVSENILKLLPFGLEIAHRSDNLKPHKKYLYAMQEHPDDIVITVDDDIIYEKNLVLSLIESYKRYPNAVSARRVHKMLKDENGILVSYMSFHGECRTERTPSFQLLATCGAGALYPPKCLPALAFDKYLIKKLCLNADDIWLKFMQLKNNVPVVWVYSSVFHNALITIPNTQDTALCITNTGDQCENDVFISRLEEYFSISLADYCE